MVVASGTSGEEVGGNAKYNDVATVREKPGARGSEAGDLGLQRQEEKIAKLQGDRANHSDNEQRNRQPKVAEASESP